MEMGRLKRSDPVSENSDIDSESEVDGRADLSRNQRGA
jgi:hypothetical protein